MRMKSLSPVIFPDSLRHSWITSTPLASSSLKYFQRVLGHHFKALVSALV
ncbi:hypothetical protein [Helicobacter vulpis]|nr:hypothetical protein [Helicobacter vulpis]